MEVRVPIVQDQTFADSSSLERRIVTPTTIRRHDRHVQVRPRLGAGCGRPLARQLPARGSRGRTSSSCSRHRASTCSTWPGDPCGADWPARPRSRERCGVHRDRRAGDHVRLSAALDSPAGQYNFLQGGNIDLTPETSDTYSYGVMFQPRFAAGPGDRRSTTSTSRSTTRSRRSAPNTWTPATANNDPAACARIHRNPATASCGSATATWRTSTSTSAR